VSTLNAWVQYHTLQKLAISDNSCYDDFGSIHDTQEKNVFKSILVGIGAVIAIVAYVTTIIIAGNVTYNVTGGNNDLAAAAVVAAIILPLIGIWAGMTHYKSTHYKLR